MEVEIAEEESKCPATYDKAKDKAELIKQAKESLEKAARRMKKHADTDRWPLEFQVGDLVLLKLSPQVWRRITDKRH